MAGGSAVEHVDAIISQFFASWNIYTTALVCVLFGALVYPLLTERDPDIHPFLLARQSQAAPIRNPEESAVLRAVDIPHGYPLRTGLGVKDPEAPRWSAGRNGDLRDIWRQAARGPVKEDGSPDGAKGKILTLLGREAPTEHGFDQLTAEINEIGKYVQEKGGKSVAICLSNSVELLCSIFAAAFYNFSVILLPYGLPGQQITALLAQCKADFLIAEAGTLDLDAVQSAVRTIRQFVWVVKGHSMHMGWADDSNVDTWHDIVAKKKSSASSEVPPVEKGSKQGTLTTFSVTGTGEYEMVEFTSDNLISGVAALNATLARAHKITSADTLLPTTSLTDSYTLSWTLAALYSNASIALNSVAGENVDLAIATASISPTIITASPKTITSYHAQVTSPTPSLPARINNHFARQTLQTGNLPLKRPTVALSSLSNLRVLLIAQPASQSPKIPSSTLSDLRLLLGARIGYALTSPKVAGAIAQTGILDYRDKGAVVCVGPPVSSVEVHLRGPEADMASGNPRGQIVVKGPSVSGGEKVVLDTIAQVDDDYTLVLP